MEKPRINPKKRIVLQKSICQMKIQEMKQKRLEEENRKKEFEQNGNTEGK